jgi:hypothetical protein
LKSWLAVRVPSLLVNFLLRERENCFAAPQVSKTTTHALRIAPLMDDSGDNSRALR